MFKPMVFIAQCCDTALLLRRPHQLVACKCKQVTMDAGNGYTHRVIGESKFLHRIKDPTAERAFLFKQEIESAMEVFQNLEPAKQKDFHSYLGNALGISRQDAKDLFYFYSYTDGANPECIHARAF